MALLEGREQLERQVTDLTTSLGRAVLLHYESTPLDYIVPTPDHTFTTSRGDYFIGDGRPSIQAYNAGALDAAIFMSLETRGVGVHTLACGENTFTQYLLASRPQRLRLQEGYVQVIDSQGFTAVHAVPGRPELSCYYESRQPAGIKVLAQTKVSFMDLLRPVITVPEDMTPSEIFAGAQVYAEVPEHEILAVRYDDEPRTYERKYLAPGLTEEAVPCAHCDFMWYAAGKDSSDALARAISMAALCGQQHARNEE